MKTNSTNGYDELQIYRGNDFIINDFIVIHQPTLGEICDFGENEYFSMVHTLTSVAADMKWQLDDIGIDYTKVKDFELFYSLLSKSFSQERTKILFGDLDLSRFEPHGSKKEQEVVLYDAQNDLVINEVIYHLMVSFLRKIHGFKKNDQIPANETTKRILIEDDREEYLRSKNRDRKSFLKSMISTLINSPGFKYNHEQVWQMKINAFIDAVHRITKIKNADLILQSGYSGFGIDLNQVSKDSINWFGEL